MHHGYLIACINHKQLINMLQHIFIWKISYHDILLHIISYMNHIFQHFIKHMTLLSHSKLIIIHHALLFD